MSLTNPAALIWATLAIPIVVFYLWKIRPRRIPVSTVMFWEQVFERHPRASWQRLRHGGSLLFQLLLLALLVLSLTEPFFNQEDQAARRRVLVIDNSASMNVTDVSPTRLEAARRAGKRLIDGLRNRDQLAIVTAGTEPRVVCGLTGHPGTLYAALAGIPATDGPTRVAGSVALARRLLGNPSAAVDGSHGIVLLSDGCFPEAAALAAAPDIRWMQFGSPAANVGITRFQARRSLVDPLGCQILIEVRNCSDIPVECRLSIDLNDNPLDVVPLRLAADGTWTHVFEQTLSDGGRLAATLEHDDALPADNRAWALLPARATQPVLLVAPEPDLFLEKAFEASPHVALNVARQAPAVLPPGTIVVYHRQIPARLPPGPVFVIDPAASCDLWTLTGKLANPIIAAQDRASPLMAHVRLENVLLPEARRLEFLKEPQFLATAQDGDALYAAFDRPEGRVLVLTVNIDQGDLPLRTAFPILATNAVNYLAASTGELREAVATGQFADLDLPVSSQAAAAVARQDALGPTAPPDVAASSLALWNPDGARRPVSVHGARVTAGPFDRCGVWTIDRSLSDDAQSHTPTGAGLLQIACNLASREESDLRMSARGNPAEQVDPRATLRPVWYYLVGAAWLLSVVEWCLYHRRWIS